MTLKLGSNWNHKQRQFSWIIQNSLIGNYLLREVKYNTYPKKLGSSIKLIAQTKKRYGTLPKKKEHYPKHVSSVKPWVSKRLVEIIFKVFIKYLMSI